MFQSTQTQDFTHESDPSLEAIQRCKLVVLDFDGVVSDALEKHLEIANRFLATMFPKSEFQGNVGTVRKLEKVGWDHFGKAVGLTEEQASAFKKNVNEFLKTDVHDVPIFEKMDIVINEAKASGKTIVIVSNNNSENIRRLLGQYGIVDSVTEIYGMEDSRTKAEKIQAAMDTHGAEKTSTVMVGDSASDIEEGKVVGVFTVATPWGFQPLSTLNAAGPDLFAFAPGELLHILTGKTI